MVTNWSFDYCLNSIFDSVPCVNLYDLPGIVAYAHLVGEPTGTASAHFAVVVQGQRHYDAGPPKAGSLRVALIDALKAVPVDPLQGADGLADGVHPLVSRNARSLCLSRGIDLVLCQGYFSGQGIDLVRAHAWIVTCIRTVIRLFQDVAAALVARPIS